MRADVDAALLREPDRPVHDHRVAGVKAAGDVGRRDDVEQRFVVAHPPRAVAFAESHVFHRGPGIVVRCPDCDHILARLSQTPTDVWLDLRGAHSWRVPFPAR